MARITFSPELVLQLVLSLLLGLTMTSVLMADHHEGEKQYIELRYYDVKSAAAAKAVDAYLADALVPALNRAGSKNIGVFREEEEKAEPFRLVVIAHDSIGDFSNLAGKLAHDDTYRKAAADYMAMNKDSPLARIRSELLHSFDCWKRLKTAKESGLDATIFELRIYESANEHFGDLKVEMFNSGEVPIFLDSGVIPIFMGQAIEGDKMPNLTYMTAYKDQASKDKAWDNFRKHADWQVLKQVEKFKGSVSKIHKINLIPIDSSQL